MIKAKLLYIIERAVRKLIHPVLIALYAIKFIGTINRCLAETRKTNAADEAVWVENGVPLGHRKTKCRGL